jgi:glycosyltransferase involved in cell wall biosynthesis
MGRLHGLASYDLQRWSDEKYADTAIHQDWRKPNCRFIVSIVLDLNREPRVTFPPSRSSYAAIIPAMPEETPLRVLLTIQSMERLAGGSLYVRDFAQELFRQGHRPAVYCRRLGLLDAQLRESGIPVSDSIERLARPDIIHGNAPIETAAAILRFPETPAIFVCHGWDSPDALAPIFPSVMRYLAVSEISRDRLTYFDGIPEQRIQLHLNPVDLKRFPQRPPLPPRPARALLFSNTISEANRLGVIEQACAQAGISLDVIGEAMGKGYAAPEELLGHYDVVFARGRAALEALACGCAVILCDVLGLGEMITRENYEILRVRNFGRRTLQMSFTADSIVWQLQRYDPRDAAAVTRLVREREGLFSAAAALVDIYRAAIREFRETGAPRCDERQQCAARFLDAIAPTSNTFHTATQVEPLERRARAAEERNRRLAATLTMPPLEAGERRRVRVRDVRFPAVAPAGTTVWASATVVNRSSKVLSSIGLHPLRIAYHWLKRGEMACFEGVRSEIYPPLPPHSEFNYGFEVRLPEEPGEYVLQVALVQEFIAWLDTPGAYVNVPCSVTAS